MHELCSATVPSPPSQPHAALFRSTMRDDSCIFHMRPYQLFIRMKQTRRQITKRADFATLIRQHQNYHNNTPLRRRGYACMQGGLGELAANHKLKKPKCERSNELRVWRMQ